MSVKYLGTSFNLYKLCLIWDNCKFSTESMPVKFRFALSLWGIAGNSKPFVGPMPQAFMDFSM